MGTAAHVEKLARAYRGVVRELTTDEANRRYRKRYLEWYHDGDGSVVISARLNTEHGLDIDAQTGVTLWGGESIDYNDAITGLVADDGIEE